MVLTLNGKYFHEKGKSSWDSPVPCSGSYKIHKKSISIYDILGKKCGVIANGVLGSAKKMENGKYWYFYMIPKIVGEYPSYKIYNEEMERVMKLLNS